MPTFDKDTPVRLTDYRFSTADVCKLSGVPDKNVRNWVARGVLPPIGERFAGRLVFNLLDALRLAAMHDLTTRVSMPPAEAAQVAELLVRQVVKHSPDGLADVNAVPRTLALVVAFVNGEAMVGLVDPAQPGGYAEWAGEWGRAHIVLPVSGLLANVIWEAISILAAQS